MAPSLRLRCLLPVLAADRALVQGSWQGRDARWPAEQAQEWFRQQPWRAGVNFLPSTASNQFEMFQAGSFDRDTLARELGWAADLGFNLVRVFLHNLLWEQEGAEFLGRVDEFLSIADGAGIGSVLVLFDGCWDPAPEPGVQREPRPGVHNSRWAQAPGAAVLANVSAHEDRLRCYVQAVVARFAHDSRVVVWDIFNEPDAGNVNSYGYGSDRVPAAMDAKGTELHPLEKAKGARALLKGALSWAWEVNPSQPLTVAEYTCSTGDEEADAYREETRTWMLDVVDVISFHSYDPLEGTKSQHERLQQLDRPLICSEYMARGPGSTFNPILGYLRDQNVWAINWGFVSGRSQTIYPWDSWQLEYTAEPEPWHHDLLRNDGTPYSEEEVNYIRDVTASARWV